MGFFNRFLAPRGEAGAAQHVQVLTFGPAVARMSIAARDVTGELDALAMAVATLGYPQGFSRERVLATAAEIARQIRIDGIAGFTDRMKTELSAAEKGDAMRLALVAVLRAPQCDIGDIGILSGMAEYIGMSRSEFRALHEACKTLA
ncbi:MAG: hypothetical protein KDK11_02110 [Maritimibacter sp.]|nr:hypothetical protein [Maritimibacter sp.]